jgi:hypothetical protein
MKEQKAGFQKKKIERKAISCALDLRTLPIEGFHN